MDATGQAQRPESDYFLKDGHIIDPGQKINGEGSIAIKNGKIAAIGPDLSADHARTVMEMRGKILVPGLIDVHCHPGAGFSRLGFPADEYGISCGVTAMGDGGSTGAANFEAFRRFVIGPAETEILPFLNIAKAGLIAIPEFRTAADIDLELSRGAVEAHRDCIKGIKVRIIEPLS
ncbi:MAG TPA: amidohydrolase/deacetylase family metallohydrolase, partial [Thermodesulfobacteriota bacterium]|nr:amidohydrolase/deacetylase family metallohydrolase [Thermodesulfobacteriota bacterium]